MITIVGIKLSYDSLVSIVLFILFLWSEYLGGSKKIKSNSVAQYLYQSLKRNRKEDDKIKQIIEILSK